MHRLSQPPDSNLPLDALPFDLAGLPLHLAPEALAEVNNQPLAQAYGPQIEFLGLKLLAPLTAELLQELQLRLQPRRLVQVETLAADLLLLALVVDSPPSH